MKNTLETPSTSPEKAMVGRYVDKNGVDHGDFAFHQNGFDMIEDAETDMARVINFNIKMDEKYAASIATTNPPQAIALYTQLLRDYASHEHAPVWKEHLLALQNKK